MPEPHLTSAGDLRRRDLTIDEYCAGVVARDVAILPRALTLVESNNPRHQAMADEVLMRLMPRTGQAVRVGVTGPPGVGKSTFIEALGLHLLKQGRKAAVLAVDPSSGVSGGSILGDKTRMPRLAAAADSYIRPSPSAGTLGGVARKTREDMLICEAAGFDVVLIETVGVGQSETMVANMTDCFVALAMPGAGDELQGIKRGLLELVNVIVVNKADGAGKAAADVAAHQYRMALESLAGTARGETPQVFTCSALEDRGVLEVWNAIDQRQSRLRTENLLDDLRRRQSLRWLWSTVEDRLRQDVAAHPEVSAMRHELERDVLEGTLPPETAARRIFEAYKRDKTEGKRDKTEGGCQPSGDK